MLHAGHLVLSATCWVLRVLYTGCFMPSVRCQCRLGLRRLGPRSGSWLRAALTEPTGRMVSTSVPFGTDSCSSHSRGMWQPCPGRNDRAPCRDLFPERGWWASSGQGAVHCMHPRPSWPQASASTLWPPVVSELASKAHGPGASWERRGQQMLCSWQEEASGTRKSSFNRRWGVVPGNPQQSCQPRALEAPQGHRDHLALSFPSERRFWKWGLPPQALCLVHGGEREQPSVPKTRVGVGLPYPLSVHVDALPSRAHPAFGVPIKVETSWEVPETRGQEVDRKSVV